MNRMVLPVIIAILILTLGCIELFEKTVYQKTPTVIKYRLSYGYIINAGANEKVNVTYLCPLPPAECILNLSVIGNYPYTTLKLGQNNVVRWCFEEIGNSIKLGVDMEVISQSYLVNLNGKNCLDIEEIDKGLKKRYCRNEGIDKRTLISVTDPEIRNIGEELKTSNNSFDVAKNIFVWLKEHTTYSLHQDKYPQSAKETLLQKSGDCDDLSILYISICRSVGIPARLVRGFLIVEENGTYSVVSHAWAEVYVGIGRNGWIPVECAGVSEDIDVEIHQNFGVENAYHLRVFVENGTNESLSVIFNPLKIQHGGNFKPEITSFWEISDVEPMLYKSLVIEKERKRYYD